MTDAQWMLYAAVIYTIAIIVATYAIFRREVRPPPRILILALIVVGFILHSIGLYGRGLSVKGCPTGNPFEVLQFISWSTILIYICTGSVFRITLLGFFSASLATLLSILSFIPQGWDHPYGVAVFGGNPLIEAHVSIALFSYGVFGMLMITSIMYLLQNFSLKHKHLRGLFRLLPSILQLDIVNQRLLYIGSTVFSFSIIIGSVHWFEHWESLSLFKLIATTLVWLAALCLSFFRLKQLIHGPRFAIACILLFLSALFALWPVEQSRKSPSAEKSVALFIR